MSRNNTFLLQDNYRDWRFKDAKLLDFLDDYPLQLRKLESALEHHDASLTMDACKELNTELLRYASALMRARLSEAARNDCAVLVAETVLDTSIDGDVEEKWEKWLSATPWWPYLATEQWQQAVDRAAAIVVENLETAGLLLDAKGRDEIVRAVIDLELQDVLAPAVYAKYIGPILDEPGKKQEKQW